MYNPDQLIAVNKKQLNILQAVDLAIEEAFKKDGLYTTNREFHKRYLGAALEEFFKVLDRISAEGGNSGKGIQVNDDSGIK